MLDKLKIYFAQVIVTRYVPAFIKGALGWLCFYIAAHAEKLSRIGLDYHASDNTITLHVTQFGLWALPLLSGLVLAGFTAFQHHAGAAIKGEPQSGDTDLQSRRIGDPPKELPLP